MFRYRRHREVPSLDTTSTADISFMLLIFFLVTSSMDTDKGLLRQLPPIAEEEQVVDIKKDDVIMVELDGENRLTCDGEPVSYEELTKRVEQLAAKRRQTHVISVQVSQQTSYDAYFQMQNAIVAAYNRLRDQQAEKQYGYTYAYCSPEEKNAVAAYYPQRISERLPSAATAAPTEQKGGQP